MREEVPFFPFVAASQGCIATNASIRDRGCGRGSASASLVVVSRHAVVVLRLFFYILGD